MKYYVLAAAAVLVGLGIVVYKQNHATSGDGVQVSEWKRTTSESETKTRPAEFADMVWTPENAEKRSPASDKKK